MTEREQTRSGERPGITSRRLLRFGIASACALVLGMWIAYRQFIYYERRAVEHLPVEAKFVARLDVEKVPVFEPVRRHLLPLIDKLPALAVSPSNQDPAQGLLARLRTSAGLNLGLDLREILVAGGPSGDDWALVVGGLFQRRGLIPAIEEALRAQAATGLVRQGDQLIFNPWGVVLAQAEDGCLILASTPQLLAQVLPATQRFSELGLSRAGAGAFFSTASSLRAWYSPSEGQLDWLGKLKSIRVTLHIGVDLGLEGQLEPTAPDEVGEVTTRFERWLQSQTLALPSIPQADWGGERAVLARTQVIQPSETAVLLSSSWQRPEFDRALRSLASWLERQLAAARAHHD